MINEVNLSLLGLFMIFSSHFKIIGHFEIYVHITYYKQNDTPFAKFYIVAKILEVYSPLTFYCGLHWCPPLLNSVLVAKTSMMVYYWCHIE